MNKKMIKIIAIVLIAVMCIFMATSVFAADDAPVTKFNITTIKPGDTEADSDIAGIGNNIISVLTSVGMVFAVAILMYIGVRYMIGSTEEKSEYKKTMLPYIIGALLLFAATAIATVVHNAAKNVGDTASIVYVAEQVIEENTDII